MNAAIPLRIGSRTVAHVRRRLVRVPLTLHQAAAASVPALPPLGEGDGYLVTSLPETLLERLVQARSDLKPLVRQRYRRAYAALDGSFDDYLSGFSAKSRSTLKRKLRKLAERSGGGLDVRCYRGPEEVDQFHRHARSVSVRTYQEQRLGAGLPEGPKALDDMRALARRDAMRGWLLFVDGEPVSYLYAPAQGDTLIYAYLGYDPDHADLSPGTVLQAEAMRQLMEEGRFRLFDFTEGDGQHKRLFATGSVDCVDLLLVRRTIGNLAAGYLLAGFDASVDLAKRAAHALRIEKLARRFTR